MSSRKQKGKSKKGKHQGSSATKNPVYRYAALLFVLTFIVFGNSIKNGYTYDDKPFISNNRIVKQGLAGIPELLRTDFWEGYTNVHQVNPSYRPVPLISLAIEYQFWGLNPRVHHLFNVLIYGFTCVLIFLLLQALFKGRYPYLALITAVLFCVHPIHTEVVANIKGRDDLLALFNGLLALYLLIGFTKNRKVRFLVGAFIMYFLALLSKGHILAWIGVVPLTLYFFTTVSWKKIAVYTGGFLGVGLLFIGISKVVTGARLVEIVDYIDNPIVKAEGIADQVATKIDVMGLFLHKLIIPYPLSSDYSYAAISPTTWGNPAVYLWLLVYGCLLYAAIRGLKRKRVYAFAILLFLVTIAPISNIFFDYVVAFAERTMYTPSLGFILLLSGLCYSGYQWLEEKAYFGSTKTLRMIALSIFGVLTLTYALISALRNPVWKDDDTLFSTDVKTMPSSVRLNIQYAERLVDRNTQDKPISMNGELEEARKCLDTALALAPDLGRAHLQYGNLYKAVGEYGKAEQEYLTTQTLDPKNPALYFNLGLMAQIHEDFEKAKQYYLQSLELYPNYSAAMANLGIIYGSQNDLETCIELLEKAVELDPFVLSVYANLERAYRLKGDNVKANYYNQRGVELHRQLQR